MCLCSIERRIPGSDLLSSVNILLIFLAFLKYRQSIIVRRQRFSLVPWADSDYLKGFFWKKLFERRRSSIIKDYKADMIFLPTDVGS